MTQEEIIKINAKLKNKTPLEIIRWAIQRAGGNAVVSTNFRPFEAVILDLATKVKPDIAVLWADHGYNKPATYKHMEALKKLLNLNIKAYVPRITAAHRDATEGPIPTPENEAELKKFSTVFKLEPFQRGMKELAPKVWITALRKEQNPNRAEMDIVSDDRNFGVLKVNPLFYWNNQDLEKYLKENDLPNEWSYFDPAKADEKRECGLHATWGGEAIAKNS